MHYGTRQKPEKLSDNVQAISILGVAGDQPPVVVHKWILLSFAAFQYVA
jgi:hypothetical protein